MAQRILLCVEPDQGTLETIQSALEPYDFDVTNISNGEQAIDWAKRNPPTLIIVSVEPRKVGYAVCNKIKRSNELKDVPLILTSSEETPQTFEQHKKLKSRANEYLIKPFTEADLVAKVNQVVPLGDVPVNSEEIMLEDEISIADSDIVEEKAPEFGSSFGAPSPTNVEAPAATHELDAIFDQETDAAFAALQSGETENPLAAALPTRTPAPAPAPEPWGASDPESWEAEATKATSIEEISTPAPLSVEPPAMAAMSDAPLFPFDAPTGDEAIPEPLPVPSVEDEGPPAPEEAITESAADFGGARSPGVVEAGRLAELEARVRDLESERDRLAADNEELRQRRDSAQSFSRDKEVLTLREIINKKEKDILDARDALDAKERQVLDHKDRIREHERSRRDLEEKSLGIEKQLMAANERIAALSQDKERGQERERSLKARLDDAHAEIQKAHDEVETLKKRLAATEEKSRSDIDRTRGELESRILELEDSHRTELTKLAEDRAAAEAALMNEQAAEVTRLGAAHAAELDAEKKRAADELASTIERLQGELARTRKDHEKALASLKEEQAVQLSAERQAHAAANDAKERDHKNELLGMRRRHEEELRSNEERRQRELAESEARHVADMEAAEVRRRTELQQRDEEHHAVIAEMDRRHFAEKSELSERHRGELDQAHVRAARAEGELAARTEELSAAHRRIAGNEADLDAARADLRDREVKLAQHTVRIAELEAKTTEYEEQIMRAFQKIRNDDRAIEKSKRALAVALSLLDERGNSAVSTSASKTVEGGTT